MSQRSNAPAEMTSSPTPGKNTQAIDRVRRALEDVAIGFGAAAATHPVLDDDLIWSIMSRLDRIRMRLLRDLKGASQEFPGGDDFPPAPRVHPALDDFLVRSRAGMGE
jgi:hypothetical protein